MTDEGRKAAKRRRRKGALKAPVERRAAAKEPAAVPADEDLRWPRVALGVILVAAGIFRIAYFLQCRAVSIFSDAPMLDAFIYDHWARKLAAGQWWSAEPYYWPPGYPYALAIFYRFVSPSVYGVYVVQFVLGLVNLALVYRLAAVAYGRRTGAVAAALAALYAPFPFQEGKVTSTMLGLSCLLWSLVVLAEASRRGGWWRWTSAGVLLGTTTLMRPEILLLVPLVLFWIFRWGGATCPDGSRTPTSAKLAAMAIFAVAWMLTIGPTAVHNLRTGGSRALISSQGGITFYQANNPNAVGLYLQMPGFSGQPLAQPVEEKAIAEKALGRSLTMGEASAYWFGRGLEFIQHDPGRFLWLLGMKFWRFIGSAEYSTDYVLSVERDTTWLLWLPFLPFGLFVALAVPSIVQGLAEARRSSGTDAGGLNATGWLLLLVLAANLATCLLFYVSSRYRLPSTIPLLVFAAATVVDVHDRLRHRRGGSAWPVVAAVAVVFLAAHLQEDERFTRFQEGGGHFNAGNLWIGKGNYANALVELRRATQLIGSYAPTWVSLGTAYQRLGRPADAASAYREATARDPKLVIAHVERGKALMEAGDWQGARAALDQAIKLAPNTFEARLAAGRAAAHFGERAAALEHFDAALRLKPDSAEARQERDRIVASP